MILPKNLQEKRDGLAREFNSKEYGSKIDFKKGFNSACNLLLPEIEKLREALQHYSNEHEDALWWPGVNRPGVEQNYGKYADKALQSLREFLGKESEGK